MSKPEFINNHKLINIITREEAEDILRKVRYIATAYEHVLVADLKDLFGIRTDYLDGLWSWSIPDIKAARIYKTDEGYEIDLPRPKIRDFEDTDKRPLNFENKTAAIHITIHTSSVDDPADVTAAVFKYAVTITDRPVRIDFR